MIGVQNRYGTKIILDRDGCKLTSDSEICTEFNDFFTSIGSHLSGKIKCKGNLISYLDSCLSYCLFLLSAVWYSGERRGT